MAHKRLLPFVDVIPRIYREVAEERFDLGRVPRAFTFGDDRFDGPFLLRPQVPPSVAAHPTPQIMPASASLRGTT